MMRIAALALTAGTVLASNGKDKTGKLFFQRPVCRNYIYNDATGVGTNTTNLSMANWAQTEDWCMAGANASWDGGTEHTGSSNFAATEEGDSCFALEGMPRPPHYKLPMCKMYNENSCCAPIHDAETQWAYETLIDVADRCLQYVNEEHFALREFFCITCAPDQMKYMSMADSGDDNNGDFAGEIRVCQSFADRMWKDGGKNGQEYDLCGFSIFTTDHGIIPFGDVHPASGDDPILPSKYWTDNMQTEDGASMSIRNDPADTAGDGTTAGVGRGLAYEAFMNSIKPGMLDNFQFRVVPDADLHCFKGAGAAGLLPQLVLVALSVFSVAML